MEIENPYAPPQTDPRLHYISGAALRYTAPLLQLKLQKDMSGIEIDSTAFILPPRYNDGTFAKKTLLSWRNSPLLNSSLYADNKELLNKLIALCQQCSEGTFHPASGIFTWTTVNLDALKPRHFTEADRRELLTLSNKIKEKLSIITKNANAIEPADMKPEYTLAARGQKIIHILGLLRDVTEGGPLPPAKHRKVVGRIVTDLPIDSSDRLSNKIRYMFDDIHAECQDRGISAEALQNAAKAMVDILNSHKDILDLAMHHALYQQALQGLEATKGRRL